MKKFLTAACIFLSPLFVFAQDITGLWQGTMHNDSTGTSLPYELLIKKEKNKYTGYSYTWFSVNGEQCYGVKKVKVSVAKDGKIVIKDDELLENTYPGGPDKNIKQLNVLDLTSNGSGSSMDGPFVTNNTKRYFEVVGSISIKRVTTLTESSLMNYFERKDAQSGVASSK